MTTINYFLILISIIYLIIGTVGFLRRRLNIRKYTYFFVIVSITIFSFGIAPQMLPGYSIEQQIFTVLVPGAGSVIVAYIILEMVERKKK